MDTQAEFPPEVLDLARFDGSVIVERTRGEIGARCDKEEMNYLALNLAHDIVTGATESLRRQRHRGADKGRALGVLRG